MYLYSMPISEPEQGLDIKWLGPETSTVIPCLMDQPQELLREGP